MKLKHKIILISRLALVSSFLFADGSTPKDNNYVEPGIIIDHQIGNQLNNYIATLPVTNDSQYSNTEINIFNLIKECERVLCDNGILCIYGNGSSDSMNIYYNNLIIKTVKQFNNLKIIDTNYKQYHKIKKIPI